MSLFTDLLKERSQLIVYHFMFGPDYKAGCPSCSSIADRFNGIAVHLENHDAALSVLSRAPLVKLQACKQRMGWTFPWASSHGGDFNFDFDVSFTEEQQGQGSIEYNYKRGGLEMDTKALGGGQMAAMCADTSPLNGMVAMYVLMSALHSAPWLKLVSNRRGIDRRS